jgi:hypothetical protein
MKANTFITTLILASATSLALPTLARAEDKSAEAKAEQPVPAKKMRPHSHAEEKTGVPAKMPKQADDSQTKPDIKKRHLHPRDGK